MDNKEKELSNYIDSLNKEQQPKVHDGLIDSSGELDKLYNTIRLVRSLRDPEMPNDNFSQELANSVKDKLSQKNSAENHKKPWFIGFAAVAAALVMVITISNLLPFGNTNVVHAMNNAFKEVKAYHGFLEIIETNANGDTITQAKLEVWANKEGQYYVKETEGSQTGLSTFNNGDMKWQIRPEENQVYLYPAFPDPYLFTFELGKEVKNVTDAMSTKIVDEDTVAGRQCSILEVSPKGGSPYHIWVDKKTKLPLQKQYAMQNALQYKVTYTKIDFVDSIPSEIMVYNLPKGFKENNTNPEQIVNNLGESSGIVDFTPQAMQNIPNGYIKDIIALDTNKKIVKQYYTTQNKAKKVVILQGKSVSEFKLAPTAVLGKVNGSTAEIMSPVQENFGILSGGGPYAGVTNINSIRWQQSGFEYAVVGNTSLEELASFVESLINGKIKMPLTNDELNVKPQVEVPVDLEIEKNEQKSVDAGHSPWRLDPVFVAQVFVSLKISPEGIVGDYPIEYKDLKIVENNGKVAVVEAGGDKSPIKTVYLKRLIRQDSTGIWTVVGYDSVDKK
jgi:outer membrane lipoprotein-sorting protein